jgi:hypothetical protein
MNQQTQDILKEIQTTLWDTSFTPSDQTMAINAIEQGKILLMPQLSFSLSPGEKELLSPNFTDPKAKQISFDLKTDLVRGTLCNQDQYDAYKFMLKRFSQYAHSLITNLLPPYSNQVTVGRTSFRAIEIAGRVTSYRKDDTRLHVDAFPSAPIQGKRILRVFTNINPNGVDRVWRIGEPFAEVIKQFLPLTRNPFPGSAALLKALKITKSYRTPYDHIMLQIHDSMKADMAYQETVSQHEIRFTPGSSWIVQTDHVSHAAMSGQHVLEQTFYLPITAMMNPELSPLRVLEKMTGKKLV